MGPPIRRPKTWIYQYDAQGLEHRGYTYQNFVKMFKSRVLIDPVDSTMWECYSQEDFPHYEDENWDDFIEALDECLVNVVDI